MKVRKFPHAPVQRKFVIHFGHFYLSFCFKRKSRILSL